MGAKKKYKIALVISIIGILSIFTGSTYALFSKTVNSNKIQVIKTGKVKVDITETQGSLTLSNFTTMEDSDGLAQEEAYSFSLKNSGDANATIKVMLVDEGTNTLDPRNVRVGLEVNNTETGPMNLYEVERIINQGTLTKGSTNTYKLRLWVDNAKADTIDTLVDQTISYKIRIMAEQYFGKEKYTAETLLSKVGTDGLIEESHPATIQQRATTDYRYTGANPNNYIKFNNEKWRIIGVFDTDDGTGKLEKRIKIIRDTLGNIAWDSNNVNDWTTATGKKLLNEGDYWNRTGSYASNGLTPEAKLLIDDAKWYLGGTKKFSSASDGLASHFYSYERGITVYSGNQTSWVGKVGLMYPSDYGYATSGGSTTNRDACLAKEIAGWESSEVSDCKDNDWLLDSSNSQWTLAHFAELPDTVFFLFGSGRLGGSLFASTDIAFRPSVYLKSDIQISGFGTSASPYEITG